MPFLAAKKRSQTTSSSTRETSSQAENGLEKVKRVRATVRTAKITANAKKAALATTKQTTLPFLKGSDKANNKTKKQLPNGDSKSENSDEDSQPLSR